MVAPDIHQKLSLSPLYFNKTLFITLYIKSFIYIYKLYIYKTLYIKSSEQSSLITGPGSNSFPPEAKNPGICHSSSQQHFNTEEILQELRVF